MRAFVAFVRPPEDMTSVFAVSGVDWVRVPVIVAEASELPADRAIVFAAPLKVTLDPVAVRLAAGMEAVFQEPATVSAALPNVRTAETPEEVRSEVNATTAEVSVTVPLNVRADATVVVMPAFTVRLYNVWVTFAVPDELVTTIVDVPGAKEPVAVLMLWTERVEEPATRLPFAATVKVPVATGRFEVVRVVTAVPPCTVTLPADRPRVDIVNVTALAPLLNATALNSLAERFAPANVIVWAEEALNVTVAVPADHEADVLALAHDPETLHASEPNAM